MLFLTETAAGYGLFKLDDSSKKLLSAERADIEAAFGSAEKAQNAAKLVAFDRFKDTKAALEETASLIEGKMGKKLKKFLNKNIVDQGIKEELCVIDTKLGAAIKDKLGLAVNCSEQTKELQRAIRLNIDELLTDEAFTFTNAQQNQMQVSLAHALSRFKLKFSPDKVDTMVIQAIGLLDDLDKDLNNFAMRLKEWYGWHFPELSKILSDSLVYAKSVKVMGRRSNAKSTDFGKIGVPEDLEEEVKRAAETSYGTEVTDEDMEHIHCLADRVINLLEYRQELATYLKTRMTAIAPNLTHLVGDLVGARLISHAGSLLNLSKHPASTIQVLGAEKALFRAMKTKSNTPKYGLLYHANLVGKSHSKFKGKIARVLGAKLALSIRVDALGEDSEATVAKAFKDYIERKLMAAEDGDDINASRKHLKKALNMSAVVAAKKAANEANNGNPNGTAAYNAEGDAMVGEEKAEKKEKKSKKRSSKEEAVVEDNADAETEAPKKKKKKAKGDAAVPVEA